MFTNLQPQNNTFKDHFSNNKNNSKLLNNTISDCADFKIFKKQLIFNGKSGTSTRRIIAKNINLMDAEEFSVSVEINSMNGNEIYVKRLAIGMLAGTTFSDFDIQFNKRGNSYITQHTDDKQEIIKQFTNTSVINTT